MDWIDEFIELFMSQKTGSVEKALLYKQQYIPQYINNNTFLKNYIVIEVLKKLSV